MRHLKFKGYSIDTHVAPIPMTGFEYRVTHEDYDGELFDEDGRELWFFASSIDNAKAYIRSMEL